MRLRLIGCQVLTRELELVATRSPHSLEVEILTMGLHDLGADVAPEKFVAAVEESDPQVLCMSALLTVTMPAMRTTIEALKNAGVRDRVKVLIGGAPVTTDYAREIGADGYGENASSAVSLVKSLVAA